MPEGLIISLFGFPGVLVSLLLSAFGIVRKSLVLCILGALFAIPFSFYLGANPGIGPTALLLPAFQFGSAWVIRRAGPPWLAWLLLLPMILTASLVFVRVIYAN